MIPPIIAAKGAQNASNAVTKPLTGDIYVRRWTTTPKKGKRKGQAIEHEVRVNAVTAAVAAVGVGLAALAGGAALWMTQQKLGKSANAKTIIRRVRVYEQTADRARRTVVTTQRGVPIKTFEGFDMSESAILGPRLASDYTASKVIRQISGTDRLGAYQEWDIQYSSATRKAYALESRKGLLE